MDTGQPGYNDVCGVCGIAYLNMNKKVVRVTVLAGWCAECNKLVCFSCWRLCYCKDCVKSNIRIKEITEKVKNVLHA